MRTWSHCWHTGRCNDELTITSTLDICRTECEVSVGSSEGKCSTSAIAGFKRPCDRKRSNLGLHVYDPCSVVRVEYNTNAKWLQLTEATVQDSNPAVGNVVVNVVYRPTAGTQSGESGDLTDGLGDWTNSWWGVDEGDTAEQGSTGGWDCDSDSPITASRIHSRLCMFSGSIGCTDSNGVPSIERIRDTDRLA